MAELAQLEIFIAVVEEGSLTGAANRLGRSLQAVSKSLQMLEHSVGSALVIRTTRKLHVSEPGRRFYERVKNALAELDQARTEVSENAVNLEGRLKISASTLFGPRYVAPIAAEFQRRHQAVSVSLLLSDELADPVKSGADITIRIGDSADSLLAGKRLGSVRRVAFAAPVYLALRGRPRRPADLLRHECVVRTGVPLARRWAFTSARNGTSIVTVKGHFESNSVAGVNAGVLAGMGVGLAAYWQIKEWLAEGRVELVLPEHEPSPLPLYALWIPTRRLSARARQFVDLLGASLLTEKL